MDNLYENTDSLNTPFEAFEGNWKAVPPHWHYFTELVYLVSGVLYAETDGKQIKMHAGDMVVFHPRHIHGFLDFDDKELQGEKLLFYVLKFDHMILTNTTPGSPKLPKMLDHADNADAASSLIPAAELNKNPVKMFFENCIWETKHKEFGYDIKVASTISLIITEIIRIWLRQGFQFSSNTTYDQFTTQDFSVLEYIDTHSAENINIEELSAKCGMCYSNFAKQFKAQFGRTCKEYIEFIRVCKADTLLLYTNNTLDYISQETGFTDASHFIRTYKKFRGITPRQRRMMKPAK